MGGKKSGGGKAPKAPDYMALARQQAELDKQAALEQTIANRPTQINNMGRMDWTRDAAGNVTQTETLDPRFQAIQDAMMGAGQGFASQISTQEPWSGGADQIQWNPEDMKEYGDAIYKSTMDRAAPQQQREQSAMNARLLQQGLQPGTAAYDRAMQNMMTSHGDVNTQAAQQATIASKDQYRQDYLAQLSGQDQNYAQDLQNYQMPWDMANAAVGSAQNTRPTFAGFNQGTPYAAADMAGAGQAQYQAKMGDYNARQAKSGKGK